MVCYPPVSISTSPALTNPQLRDNLLRRGCEGGEDAARGLSDSVRNYIRRHVPGASHIHRIMARIYANISELSRALGRGDDAVNRETVNAFVQGFTSSQLLFDFIDTGTEEQGAEKLRGKVAVEPSGAVVANRNEPGL